MAGESQLLDFELCARICRRIDEGRLPVIFPDTINAGRGSRSKCHACDQPIDRSEIQYQVKAPGTVLLRLHLGCYVLWQIECVRRMRELHQDNPTDQRARPKDASSKNDPSRVGTLLH